jgi:Na+/melibiose symporter-like transporter
LAATSHVAKTTTRAAVNTSPEPFSNIGMSLLGDAAVPAALWLSWSHPAVFGVALVLMLVLMVALIWVFSRYLRQLASRVSAWRRPSLQRL